MTISRELDRKPGELAASCGLVIIFWLIAISRWIVSDKVVPWDSKNQFYAFFRFLSATLHAGDWPFWNPYHYSGHPSVADPQSLVSSAVFVAWGAFDAVPTMRTFDIVILAHLLAGSIAVTAIGWRARWPVPACVLAAALFMFGGAASARLQHTGIVLSYSLLPLALLLLQLALERSSHTLAIAFAIVAANIALGRSQVALLLCALLLAAAAAEILRAQRPTSCLRERLGVLATMAAGGTALLIVPMLLTLQFAQLSNRPSESLEDALRGSLHPANLATLAVPDIFGTHADYWGPGAATSPEVAFTDDSENYLFVGAVPILLVLWLGVAGGSMWRPGRRLLAATLIVACLFMLGRYTPLYPMAFQHVSGISLFRRPTDASFVFGIALAVLAGHCLADYVREGLPRFRLSYVLAIVSAVLAVIGSAVLFSAQSGHALNALRGAAISAVVIAVAITILVSARQGRARLTAAILITLIAMAELLWWNVAFRLNAESRSLYAVLEEPTGAEAAAIARLETAIGEDHARGDYPRVEVVGLGGPWQNLAMVRGWEATNGYNPLRIGFYDRLVAPGEENWNIARRRFPSSFDSYDCALARALGLTYLVLGQPVDRMPGLATPPAADLLLAGPPVWIYRLKGAMPRVSLSSGDARIVSSRPDRVELVADSARGGLLTLHDIYYPGWFAEIDGKPAPILRADILFRGVELPAGPHHVTFRFAPLSLANLRDALNAVLARPSSAH